MVRLLFGAFAAILLATSGTSAQEHAFGPLAGAIDDLDLSENPIWSLTRDGPSVRFTNTDGPGQFYLLHHGSVAGDVGLRRATARVEFVEGSGFAGVGLLYAYGGDLPAFYAFLLEADYTVSLYRIWREFVPNFTPPDAVSLLTRIRSTELVQSGMNELTIHEIEGRISIEVNGRQVALFGLRRAPGRPPEGMIGAGRTGLVVFGVGDFALHGFEETGRFRPPPPAPMAITIGANAVGTLQDGDYIRGNEAYTDCYVIAGLSTRVRFELRSTEFRGFLEVGQRTESGCAEEALTHRTDSGDVTFELDDSADYIVRVSSREPYLIGSYELRVEDATVPEPIPLDVGDVVDGTLEQGDFLSTRDAYLDCFVVRGQGVIVEFDVTHPFHYQTLQVGPATEAGCAAENYSHHTDISSHSALLLEDGVDYIVRVVSDQPDRVDAYSLSVALSEIAIIEIGDNAIEGALTDGDYLSDRSAIQDCYLLAGDGGTYQITLSSDAFEPFLQLAALDGRGCVVSGGQTNEATGGDAELVLTLSEGVLYLIRASSLESGQTGTYRLRLDPIEVDDD